MLPFLYVVAVLISAAAVTIGVRYARLDTRLRNPDTLPVVTAMIAVGATLLVIALQLTRQPGGELRAILTAGVVCGGVVTAIFALWLNHRRYRVEEARQRIERDRVQLERSRHWLEQEKIGLEQTSNRREHVRVADETLMAAAELFGHNDSRVRAGALHALAGFTAHRPDRAQDVAELVCMYLRNTPAGDRDPAMPEALRVLLRIIEQANRQPRPVHDLEIDLCRATLDGLALDQVTVRTLNLSGARLTGTTSLRRFGRPSSGATPAEAPRIIMDGAEFGGPVWLHGARLRGLRAAHATFGQGLWLEGAIVEQDAVLSDCALAGDVDFTGATLGTLTCSASKFNGRATFRRVHLHGLGNFLQTWFDTAEFEQFSCGHRVVFDEAHFETTLRMHPSVDLPQVSLRRTTLAPKARASERLLLPPHWQVTPGNRDDVAHLIAGAEPVHRLVAGEG